MSTIPSSRFNRTGRSSEDEKPAAPLAPVATQQPQNQIPVSQGTPQELARLQERLQKTQRERMQRELELTAAQKTLQECQDAAKKLGINSLEEMEAYVQQLEEEDARALDEFENLLSKEEQMLARVAQQLQDLERE